MRFPTKTHRKRQLKTFIIFFKLLITLHQKISFCMCFSLY